MQLVAKALILTALTVGIWMYLARGDAPSDIDLAGCTVGYVYDGDTVALTCDGSDEVTARVQGLDAPETKLPGCDAELAHGTLATERLRDLVKSGEVSFEHVGIDKYDRPLIRLSVDGEDVAETLVREGLAVTYEGGTRINWCEKLEAQ